MWAVVASRTTMAEALRLIGEQMELERRSLGPERTTGCLRVVYRYRSRLGTVSDRNSDGIMVELLWNYFFCTRLQFGAQIQKPAHVQCYLGTHHDQSSGVTGSQ